jgi:hypothetical protein
MTKINMNVMKILDHNNINSRYRHIKRQTIISLLIWGFAFFYTYSSESLPKGKLFSQEEIITYGKQQLNALLDANELNQNNGDTSCNQYIYFTKNIDLPIEKVQEYVWAENYQNKQEQFKTLNDELKRINQGLVAPMYIGINLDMGRVVVDTKISSQTKLSVLNNIQIEEHQRDLKKEIPKTLNTLYTTINKAISTGAKSPISIHVLGFFQIFYSEGIKDEVFLNTWRAQSLTMKNFGEEGQRVARIKKALKQGGTIGFFIDDKKNIKQESATNYLNRYRAAVKKYWDDDTPNIDYVYTYNNIEALKKWYDQDLDNNKELNPFVPSANYDQRVYDYTGLFYSYKSKLEEHLSGYKNVKENYKVVLTDAYTPNDRIAEIDKVLREGNFKGSVIRIHIDDQEKVIQQNIYRNGRILNLDPTLSRRIQEFGDLVFNEGFSSEKALLIMLEMETIITQFGSVVFGGLADGIKAVKIPKEFWDSASEGYYFKEIVSLTEGVTVLKTTVARIQNSLALITGAYNGLVDTLATVPDLAGKIMDMRLFMKRIFSDQGYREEVIATIHKIVDLLKQPEMRDYVWMLAGNQLKAMWDKEYNKVVKLGDYTGVSYFAGNIVFAVAVGILSGGSSMLPKVAKDFLTLLKWVIEPMEFLRKVTGKKLDLVERIITKLVKKGYTITKNGVVMIGKDILFSIEITEKIIKVAYDAIIKPGNTGMYTPEVSLAIPEGYSIEGISLKDRWIHIMKGSDGSYKVSGDAADDWLRFIEDLGDDWDKLTKQEFIDEVTTTNELKELFLEADYDDRSVLAKVWKLLKEFSGHATRENIELFFNTSKRFNYNDKKGIEGVQTVFSLIKAKEYEIEHILSGLKTANEVFDSSIQVVFSAKELGSAYIPIILDLEGNEVCYLLREKISKKQILPDGKLIIKQGDLEIYQNGKKIGFIGDKDWKITQLPKDVKSYKNVKLGEKINTGQYKVVHEISGEPDKVIAILKEGKDVKMLNYEVEALQKISEKGFPIVKIIEKTTHDGHPAIVMERFEEGSKDIISGKIESKFLNAKSIEMLFDIRKKIEDEKVRIYDLQFLIAKDGSVVIADPTGLEIGGNPSVNLDIIDKLIAKAEKAIEINWEFLNNLGKDWKKKRKKEFIAFVKENFRVQDVFFKADNEKRKELAKAWMSLYDYPELRNKIKILESYIKVPMISKYGKLSQPILRSKLTASYNIQGLRDFSEIENLGEYYLRRGFDVVGESIQVMKLPEGTLLVIGTESNDKLKALEYLGQSVIPAKIRSFQEIVDESSLEEALTHLINSKLSGDYKGDFLEVNYPYWKDDFYITLIKNKKLYENYKYLKPDKKELFIKDFKEYERFFIGIDGFYRRWRKYREYYPDKDLCDLIDLKLD